MLNGNYVVKLHFAETFEGIKGPGERVFSINVQGRDFKDFDRWVKAGGPLKAYVETVPVEVTDGKVRVTITPKVENPQICAKEIIPYAAVSVCGDSVGSGFASRPGGRLDAPHCIPGNGALGFSCEKEASAAAGCGQSEQPDETKP